MGKQTELKSRNWRGRAFILSIFALLAIGLVGVAVRSAIFAAIGFLPLLALMLWFKVRDNRRAAHDPAFAAQREKDRAEIRDKVAAFDRKEAPRRSRFFWYQILGVPGAAILVVLVRHPGPFASWEKQEAILFSGIILVSLALSVIMINVISWIRRRQR